MKASETEDRHEPYPVVKLTQAAALCKGGGSPTLLLQGPSKGRLRKKRWVEMGGTREK